MLCVGSAEVAQQVGLASSLFNNNYAKGKRQKDSCSFIVGIFFQQQRRKGDVIRSGVPGASSPQIRNKEVGVGVDSVQHVKLGSGA